MTDEIERLRLAWRRAYDSKKRALERVNAIEESILRLQEGHPMTHTNAPKRPQRRSTGLGDTCTVQLRLTTPQADWLRSTAKREAISLASVVRGMIDSERLEDERQASEQKKAIAGCAWDTNEEANLAVCLARLDYLERKVQDLAKVGLGHDAA